MTNKQSRSQSKETSDRPREVGSPESELQATKAELAYERETNLRLRRALDELTAEREAVLSIRDYAIGMEQELGQARARLENRDNIDHELRKEIIATHAHLAAAIADSQAAHKRLSQEPTARLRRALRSVARKTGLK